MVEKPTTITEAPPYERFKDYTTKDLQACSEYRGNSSDVREMARSEIAYRKPIGFFRWLWWELTG